jgi:hypothetical protein
LCLDAHKTTPPAPQKKQDFSLFFWVWGSFNVLAWVGGSIYQEKPWPKLTLFSFLKTLCLRALGSGARGGALGIIVVLNEVLAGEVDQGW